MSDFSENRENLIGKKFPKLDVATTKGDISLPGSFENKWFVLFSHPKDFTAICAAEFVSFGKMYSKFKSLDCELIGLSLDSLDSHKKWTSSIYDKYDVEIEYPVISDSDGVISSKLGILYSKDKDITVRSVFVVDGGGIIRAVLHYPPELHRDVDEIIRIVSELKKFDETSGL